MALIAGASQVSLSEAYISQRNYSADFYCNHAMLSIPNVYIYKLCMHAAVSFQALYKFNHIACIFTKSCLSFMHIVYSSISFILIVIFSFYVLYHNLFISVCL